MKAILSALLFLSASLLPAGAGAGDWHAFAPVKRPPVPEAGAGWARNEIDRFIASEHAARGLAPRAEASAEVLLRRLHLDVTGLAPTPEERAAFLANASPDAYDRAVERLLADPRHGERWARHWMDVWRYSDWAGWAGGNQIRDSQPHIWKWRDWIVEALNADKSYDRMVVEMLAADEAFPEDTSALRATGFLVRNYKMLSREQWLEDTVNHTSQAFMGVTMGCAKCHDHRTDPVSQQEYYALRAVFEPHQVRIDHVPGQPDPAADGLARVYDADLSAVTYFLNRGDERNPDKNRPVAPGVPAFLGGVWQVEPVALPASASRPQRREFVRADALAASSDRLASAIKARDAAENDAAKSEADKRTARQAAEAAAAAHRALDAVLKAERLEEEKGRASAEWRSAADAAVETQREQARLSAEHALQNIEALVDEKRRTVLTALVAEAEAVLQGVTDRTAQRAASQAGSAALAEAISKRDAAAGALRAAVALCSTASDGNFTPRAVTDYPETSSGRRLALAKWLTAPEHPLFARVAVNHVWARHFGHALAPSVANFGKGTRPPSHPELLDWLAAEFQSSGYSFRHLHRLILRSAVWRQVSAHPGAEECATRDPDNTYLWHWPARRLEAEAVRDNVLWTTCGLDPTRGGPELDAALAETSPRRSLYLRCAHEKHAEFLQVFDGPSVVECYERKPTVMPQQALALLNSTLASSRADALTKQLEPEADSASFVRQVFVRLLAREPKDAEMQLSSEFLGPKPDARRRARFVLTMLNHHEFLTIL